MNEASYFFHNGVSSDWKECILIACEAAKLKAELRKGSHNFVFKKKCGEIREAIGTLNPGLINYEYKGSVSKFNPAWVKYYDLDKDAFRSFKVMNYYSAITKNTILKAA